MVGAPRSAVVVLRPSGATPQGGFSGRNPKGSALFWPLAVLRHRPRGDGYATATAPTQMTKTDLSADA